MWRGKGVGGWVSVCGSGSETKCESECGRGHGWVWVWVLCIGVCLKLNKSFGIPLICATISLFFPRNRTNQIEYINRQQKKARANDALHASGAQTCALILRVLFLT